MHVSWSLTYTKYTTLSEQFGKFVKVFYFKIFNAFLLAVLIFHNLWKKRMLCLCQLVTYLQTWNFFIDSLAPLTTWIFWLPLNFMFLDADRIGKYCYIHLLQPQILVYISSTILTKCKILYSLVTVNFSYLISKCKQFFQIEKHFQFDLIGLLFS